jgi:PAS domain S-box-containing protein
MTEPRLEKAPASKASANSDRISEKRFQALVQAHSAMVWTTDGSGAFVSPQEGWQSYTGQTWEECRGRGGFLKIHPADRDRVQAAWASAVAGKGNYHVEFRLWHAKSNNWRWCSSRGVPIADDSGEVLEWVGTMVDIDTRMRAEQELQESERRFRSIFETVQAVGLMLDASGRVSFANDYLLQLTGWTREEVIGQDYFELFIEGSSDIQHRFERALRDGEIFPHAENEILTRSGEKRWIAWDNATLHDGDGKVVGTASIGRDITEARCIQQKLLASEERFRTLVEAMPQLVWATRPDGYSDYLSSQWVEYTGVAEIDARGHAWLALIHPDDFSRTKSAWFNFINMSVPYDTEYRLRRKDGVYRWFKARGALLKNDAGEVVRIFGTSTDIHVQKTAEEALKRNKESLQAALAASETGTFQWDPTTDEFLEVDENLLRLFGYEPEVRIRKASELVPRIHPDERPFVEKALEACRYGADFEAEFRVVLPNGDVRWLYDRGRMMRDSEDRPQYLVGACTDITLRKRAEEVMLRSEKLAAAGSLAATLAHEINNPLEAVLNLIYLARQRQTSDEQRTEMLQAAEAEITRAAELATRSLRFYRAKSQEKAESLQRVLDSVLYVYGPKLQQRGIKLDKRYLLDAAVSPSESDLRQILYNLVSNAVDAMPSGGTLSLKLSSVGSWSGQRRHRITIGDTGMGIASDARGRMFKPFFTTKGETGTGLGLWVSREIAERYGGTIRYRTKTDQHRHGTVFSVVLPAVRKQQEDGDEPFEISA